MRINTFLAVNSIVGMAFGIVLVVSPQALLAFNGINLNAAGLSLARLLGAEFIGFNIATWAARNAGHQSPRRAVVFGHMASESLGFVVLLAAKLAGVGNNMLWGILLIYLAFALGYAYFLFATPDSR